MKSKRVIYIDVIRVVAMILVVLAHSCSFRIGNPDGSLSWGGSNVIVGITEVAVPMFFMISGATILNSKKTYSVSYLFKHRLVRVVVPFVLWSIISAYPGSKVDGVFNLHQFMVTVALIFHQPVLISYWFIYSLFGLYLISPFLKLLVDKMDKSLLNYLLWLWMVMNVFLPAVVQFTPERIGNIFNLYSMAQIILSSYLGYFILGYLMTKDVKLKATQPQYLILLLVLFVIKVVVRFIPSHSPLFFLNIVSPLTTPIISTLLFLILKEHEGRYSNGFSKVIEFIAPLTYGIYLIHGLAINVVVKFVNSANYLGVFIIGLILSTVIIYVLHKIPIVKNLLT